MKTVDCFGETFPAKYAVCSRCHGEGHHTNPAIDGDGLTASDIEYHMDGDSEFLDNYFSGVYDVVCHSCDGKRVELVPDFDRMTTQQRKDYEEARQADLEDRLMRQAELRAGC